MTSSELVMEAAYAMENGIKAMWDELVRLVNDQFESPAFKRTKHDIETVRLGAFTPPGSPSIRTVS